jgi:Domain of Unknown Function (DUF928)
MKSTFKFFPKKSLMFIMLVLISVPVFPSNLGFAAQPSAQSRKSRFNLPPRRASGPRSDAGARDSCPAVSKPLTAIASENNFGYTLKGRPTLLIYVPYESTEYSQMKLELSVKGAAVATSILNAPKQAGVVGIPLPQQVSSLDDGVQYNWTLTYSCDSRKSDGEKLVKSSIERMTPSSELQISLNQAQSVEEQIEIYAQAGIWYDMVGLLLNERLAYPDSKRLTSMWEDLLEQEPGIGLQSFTGETLREYPETQDK